MIRRSPTFPLFPYTTLFRSIYSSESHDYDPLWMDFFDSSGTALASDAWTTRYNMSQDRKSTRLNSSHSQISYAVFCLKKKKQQASLDNAPIQHTLEPDTAAR